MSRTLAIAALIPFCIYTTYAVAKIGYFGIFASHLHIAGIQVLCDLVIACTLAMIWMWNDAKAKGRSVWPFLVLTLTAGSIGPLLYLALAPKAQTASRPVMA